MELNELSASVYERLIRFAVPDVTESEIIDAMSYHANDNPFKPRKFYLKRVSVG